MTASAAYISPSGSVAFTTRSHVMRYMCEYSANICESSVAAYEPRVSTFKYIILTYNYKSTNPSLIYISLAVPRNDGAFGFAMTKKLK
jgi:hypothetical protein